jgi:hypothetical protein
LRTKDSRLTIKGSSKTVKFSTKTDTSCITRGSSKTVKFSTKTDTSCITRGGSETVKFGSETDISCITRGGSETGLAAKPLYLYIIAILVTRETCLALNATNLTDLTSYN